MNVFAQLVAGTVHIYECDAVAAGESALHNN